MHVMMWHPAGNMAGKLMPPGVRSLRYMLHATAVEVLLHLMPLHCWWAPF